MAFLSLEYFNNSRYMQLIASIAAAIAACVTGMYISWSSPAVPRLTGLQEDLDFQFTTEEASWVVSGYTLGLVVGNLLVSFPTNRLGRRVTLLTSAPLMFISWIGVTFSRHYIVMLFFRLVGGIGASFVFLASSLYVSEIADKDLRGRLTSVLFILKLSGNLYVLSVGPFVSYRVLGLTCSVVPLVFFVALFFMPESSYFYLKNGNIDKARSSLERLSPASTTKQEIEEKLKLIQSGVERDMRSKSSLKELFTNKIHRKALYVMLGLKVLQQLSGITAIESYMETIIEKSGSSLSGDMSSIIFGIVQFGGAISSTTLIDRFGRKPLLLISAVGCGVSLIAEGIYFYLSDVLKADVGFLSWLPTTGLTVYLYLSSAGIYTLPYLYLGEIFATNVKENAGAFASCFGSVLSFAVTKSFSPMEEALGIYTVFWIFAAVCCCGSVFVFMAVPETKNKSLKDIQDKLNKHLKAKEAILEEGNLEMKQRQEKEKMKQLQAKEMQETYENEKKPTQEKVNQIKY